MGYSGAGGKLIHKKTRSKKSRDAVPFLMITISAEGLDTSTYKSAYDGSFIGNPKVYQSSTLRIKIYLLF
jgi:hypothetical protein